MTVDRRPPAFFLCVHNWGVSKTRGIPHAKRGLLFVGLST